MADEIKVYQDVKLMELAARMAPFWNEEAHFLLEENETNARGRTRKDLAKDMIEVYEETNKHLKENYPNNTVAESWIATNSFHAQTLKEIWM